MKQLLSFILSTPFTLGFASGIATMIIVAYVIFVMNAGAFG